MKKVLLAIVILFVCVSPSLAATVPCDGSLSDCQSKVTAASNGDIITIPAGSFTWASELIIDSKNITIQGEGKASTTLIPSAGHNTIRMSGDTQASRITGITFSLPDADVGGVIVTGGHDFRIDDCAFTSTVWKVGVAIQGAGTLHPYGVINANEFNNTRVMVIGTYSDLGFGPWLTDLNLGTDEALYVENNKFNFTVYGNALDANEGGKTVIRYNTLTDTYIEQHSVQGDHRGTRKWEIYNNHIVRTSANVDPLRIRAGTGVIFNNKFIGWVSPSVVFDNVRSYETRGTYALQCNGLSPWDGNTANEEGWPCRDQIGRSTDSGAWAVDDNPVPSQASDPAYVWGNVQGGTTVGVRIGNSCENWIQEDRDYFLSEKAGYTPFECPHPLVDPTNAQSCDTDLAGDGTAGGYGLDTETTYYNITPSVASGSGTISPAVAEDVVSGGNSSTYTISPYNGWKGTFSGTCGATGVCYPDGTGTCTYQKTNVTEACTVIVTFSEIMIIW